MEVKPEQTGRAEKLTFDRSMRLSYAPDSMEAAEAATANEPTPAEPVTQMARRDCGNGWLRD